MDVPLIVLTDGRPHLHDTLASLRAHLAGVEGCWLVDDSGDPNHRAQLRDRYPDTVVVPVAGPRAGYWQAMRAVFTVARALTTGYVAFWEDDFLLTQPVDATDLAHVLDDRPYLTQVALLRQPWFANEHAAGGLIEALEQQGQKFDEVTDGTRTWVEHRAGFTGNPSVLPRRTYAREWPAGAWSESRFGRDLLADPEARGAYWGRRTDPPRVEHVGRRRAGRDY